MAKFLAAIAVLAVTGSVCDAATYNPLQNPGRGQCMNVGKYDDSRDQYQLTLAECKGKRTLGFRHEGNGKALRTADSYCLSTQKNTKDDNVRIVLTDCPKKLLPGQKWTKAGRNQWKNGYGKCLDYDSSKKAFRQAKCATLANTDKTSLQQYVLLKDAAPKPTSILCADWLKTKYSCPAGLVPIADPNALICLGTTGPECSQICCRSPPKPVVCGDFSIKCGYNNRFQPARQCNNPGQQGCNFNTCCDPIGPIKCGQAGVQCGYGTKLMYNQMCGDSRYGTCNPKTCCAPITAPKTCSTSNYKCPYGTYRLDDQLCNNPSSPSCSSKVCCREVRTCGSQNYKCPYGQDRNDAIPCNNGIDPKCSAQVCCKQPSKPRTCGTVNFNCGAGGELQPNVQCGNGYDSACSGKICCKPTAVTPTTCADSSVNCGSGTLKPGVLCGNNGNPKCTSQLCCDAAQLNTCGDSWSCTNGGDIVNPNKACNNPGSPNCDDDLCCSKPAPPAVAKTCSSEVTCGDGKEAIPEYANQSCGDLGGCSESKCCKVNDQCGAWLQRSKNGDANLDLCYKGDYTGPVTASSDTQATCTDDSGNNAPCSAKLCCVKDAPQPPTLPPVDNGAPEEPQQGEPLTGR